MTGDFVKNANRRTTQSWKFNIFLLKPLNNNTNISENDKKIIRYNNID